MSDWQFAATAFTPYHDAIQADRFTNANGNVRFKDGKTGIIWLSCNVDSGVKFIKKLFLTWFEPTGLDDPDYQVSATLKRVSKSQGSIENITTVSSEGYPAADSLRTRESVPLQPGHTFDHRNYYYYIILTLKRSQPDIDVKAFGVSISTASP